MPVAERMTAAKFHELSGFERGRPWNLVNGEVVVNEPTALHGEVAGELLFALETWARAERGRGRVALPRDVQLDDLNVFAPDILWYAEGRVPPRDAPPPYPMPDIAVEVRSPATWRYDIGEKKSGYERHGLPELWLVDTAAEVVLVFRRSTPGAVAFDVALELGGDQRLASPQLPGFGPAVESLFSR
ncbi:MAG: Uma2 family endonuclease [Thermoleophilaceae bacterium]|nr:Uma2 family endonuclease [Thermoleophilaceae bacterium]